MDTLADTAQAIRSKLRPGELAAVGRTALAASASASQRAGAIGVLQILAADDEARAHAGTSVPSSSSWSYRGRLGASTPAPDPVLSAASEATFARLAAEVIRHGEEARWAASDRAVFGIETGPAGAANLSAEEARWEREDLVVFGIGPEVGR